MLLEIVLICLAVTGGRAADNEMASECGSSVPTFQKGQTGNITCSFPVDIRDKQFTVDLYENEKCDTPKRKIVDCYFIETERYCEVKSGFIFNYTPGKVQTVQVVNATEQSAGVYRCRILDVIDTLSNHCTVNYAGANIQDSKQMVPERAEKEKKGMTPRDPGTDPTSPQLTSVIVGICVGAGVVGSSVAVGILIIRRRKRKEEERNNRPKKNLIYNPLSTNPAVTV